MIPEVNPYNNYRGDGVATKFDFDFYIQNGSQLIVEKIDENDVAIRLEENIDYEIAIIDDEIAGFINFPIEDSRYGVLQENETLSLQLTLPFEQISEYGQSSLLDLNSIEFSLDYLTRLCQILRRQMERSLKVNEGSNATPEDLLESVNNNAVAALEAVYQAQKEAQEAQENADRAEIIKNNVEEISDEIEKLADEIKNSTDDIINRVSFSMFDTVLKDHILTYEESKGLALQGTYVYKNAVAGSRYGYPDFYNTVLAEKENADPTEVTLGENTITIYVNANGHQFYDIANKSIIDEIYNSTGLAWFYGVDEENERVFLPRDEVKRRLISRKEATANDSTWYNLYSDGWLEQGGSEAFTSNVTAQLVTMPLSFKDINYVLTLADSDVDGTASGAAELSWAFKTVNTFNFTRNDGKTKANVLDWSACGYADISEIPAISEKYLYICVGNTNVENATTDIIDVTTTENDTIPLGYFTRQTGSFQPSFSWLKSEGQWNDGNVYATFYNEFANRIGETFANGSIVNSSEGYTDYDLVINQDDLTFRLPLLTGDEIFPDYNKETEITLETDYIAEQNILVNAFNWGSGQSDYNDRGAQIVVDGISVTMGRFFYHNGANFTAVVRKGSTYRVEVHNSGSGSTRACTYPLTSNGSLYFKVANAVQNLELLDASKVLEAVEKLTVQLQIIESYVNGTEGYNIYSNGYCEQWGKIADTTTSGTVTYLKSFKDVNYNLQVADIINTTTDTGGGGNNPIGSDFTVNGFRYDKANTHWICWKASGYIA